MKKIVRIRELQLILVSVRNYMGIDVCEESRLTEYVRARSIYFKLCKDLTNFPMYRIAGQVNRDHSTLLYALKYFERDILNDNKYKKIYYDLHEVLEQTFIKSKKKTYTQPVELAKINSKITELLIHNDLLKSDNDLLKKKLDKSIDLEDSKEMEMISLFRSLNEKEKADTMFKIRTAKKVSEKMKIQRLMAS